MTETLSCRELLILENIRGFHTRRGYPPTIRELCQATGINSTSLMSWYIDKLAAAGKIKKDPAVARGIVVI